MPEREKTPGLGLGGERPEMCPSLPLGPGRCVACPASPVTQVSSGEAAQSGGEPGPVAAPLSRPDGC
jgi:hypothetical protein